MKQTPVNTQRYYYTENKFENLQWHFEKKHSYG